MYGEKGCKTQGDKREKYSVLAMWPSSLPHSNAVDHSIGAKLSGERPWGGSSRTSHPGGAPRQISCVGFLSIKAEICLHAKFSHNDHDRFHLIKVAMDIPACQFRTYLPLQNARTCVASVLKGGSMLSPRQISHADLVWCLPSLTASGTRGRGSIIDTLAGIS